MININQANVNVRWWTDETLMFTAYKDCINQSDVFIIQCHRCFLTETELESWAAHLLWWMNESQCFSSSSSEHSLSLKRLFLSMFSFTFLRLSCFLCMDSLLIFSSSLSSPLNMSSFSRRISRARFRFTSTDLVSWHWEWETLIV